MTLIFLDTEFNGFGGDLISMALVPATDVIEPWYEVCDCKVTDPWVKEHVVPILGKAPLHPMAFKASFQRYIVRFRSPVIIADWYEDAVHFCKLMAGKDYGSSLALEFAMKLIRITDPSSFSSETPHNALSDAKALKEWWFREEDSIMP